MKRFFPSACFAVVISLLFSVIWLNQANAAMPALSPQGELTGLLAPRALDVDGLGNLYVAESSGAGRGVKKFDKYGRLQGVFDSAVPDGNGVAVAPDGQTLYVTTGYKAVAVCSALDGRVYDYLKKANGEAYVFSNPGEIDLDGRGYIFVANTGNYTIDVFFPDGTYSMSFGGRQTGSTAVNGKFRSISALTVNPVGSQVLVSDDYGTENGRLHIFSTDGVFVASMTAATLYDSGNFSARGSAFDSSGRVYFLRYIKPNIRIFNAVPGTALGNFNPVKVSATQEKYLTAPVDIIFDPLTSRLFVSDGVGIEIFGVDGGITPVYVNNKPTVPVQQSPVGGSEVTTTTPVLEYAAATDQDGDALSYQVIVRNGETVVYETRTVATSVMVPAGRLEENKFYGWTVEAFDSEGAGSGATLPATFVVNAVNEPPSAPVLVTPLNGETLAGDGRLTWEPSTDPDPNDTLVGYQVEVATDATFASPVLTARVIGTSVALTDFSAYAELVDGDSYSWRVSAIDCDDLISAFGAFGSFVYDTTILKVTANMSGANVYFGGNHAFSGRFVGTAPLELRDLTAGAYSVVVERAGFEPYVTQITFSGTENIVINALFEPALQPVGMHVVGNGVNGRSGLAVSGAAAPFLVDFDNDSLFDLLVGDAAGQLTLFPAMQLTSRGQLYFQPGKSLGLPVMPGAVPFVADWNNDGRKDLLVGQADGTVKLFLNAGQEATPAFGAGQDLVVVGTVLNVGGKAAPVVLDFDRDGVKDLVVGNAAGQVLAFRNEGTDAAVQLAAPVLLAQFAAAVVPASVDWDADGWRDLLVTVNGQAILLRNDFAATGTFTVGESFPVDGANALFPLDIDSVKGKDLLVGQADGKLAYWVGNGSTLTAAALAGLLAKVDKIEALVAAEAPALLSQVDKVRRQITAGSLAAAAKTATTLADQLPEGAARTSVQELIALCQ